MFSKVFDPARISRSETAYVERGEIDNVTQDGLHDPPSNHLLSAPGMYVLDDLSFRSRIITDASTKAMYNLQTTVNLLRQWRGSVLKQRRTHQLLPVVQHDGILTGRKDSLVASLDRFGLVGREGVREGFAVLAVIV